MPSAPLTSGSIYFSSEVETVLAADTYAKCLGATTTGDAGLDGFAHTADNELGCITPVERKYQVGFGGSAQAAGVANCTFSLAKNGVQIPGSHVHRKIANANSGAFPVDGQARLKAGDVLSLHCKTDLGVNLTITAGVLFAFVIG